MLAELLKQFKQSAAILGFFTLLTGVLYPAIITSIAFLLFPHESGGSLIKVNQRTVGSGLIGQPFNEAKYFFGRPSATTPYPYNGLSSSGSNLGPTNPALINAIKQRIKILEKEDLSNSKPIPIDLVTASGSGLDPHISPQAAYYQVSRIARSRNMPVEEVQKLVDQAIENRQFGILGNEKINVLKLNLRLDAFSK